MEREHVSVIFIVAVVLEIIVGNLLRPEQVNIEHIARLFEVFPELRTEIDNGSVDGAEVDA